MSERKFSTIPDVPSLLQRALVGLVDQSRRHAWFVMLVGLLLAGASGLYANRHLGINTDTDQMFAASLPWRQHAMALDRAFPQSQGLLVAVIDGDTPEAADATARGLAHALSDDHAHFTDGPTPGCLSVSPQGGVAAPLDSRSSPTCSIAPSMRSHSWASWRPIPTARGLFSALSLLGQGVTHGDADLTPYLGQLRTFHTAMAAALGGHPQDLSWQRLLSGKAG